MLSDVANPIEEAVRTPSRPSLPLRVNFLDAAQLEDRKKWLDLWTAWPEREVMAHPDYVRLFARPQDRVMAATLQTAGGGILYPVILRPIAAEPWAAEDTAGCDLTTAYGYGGPFCWSTTPEMAQLFWSHFDSWALAQKAVTSFARLSLFPSQLLSFNGETLPIAPNIVRRLDMEDEELWADYEREARKNIEVAVGRGLTVGFDASGKTLDDFHEIYTSTLHRRGALQDYYYSRAFFERLVQDLPGQFVIAHAMEGRESVSAELVLLSVDHAYSFLGGTLREAYPLCPNYLLKHRTFLWCRDRGIKKLVLGGGYQPQDGILRYKKHFARRAQVTFTVGRKIYNSPESQRLVDRRRLWMRGRGLPWSPAAGFFPEYRSPRTA